jgi:hypothetical protein
MTIATPRKTAARICRRSGRYCQSYGVGFIAQPEEIGEHHG